MTRRFPSYAIWATLPLLALAACDTQEPTASSLEVPSAPQMHGDGSENGHSHGRFSHITWAPRTDIAPHAVEFTYKAGFRRSGYSGTGSDGRPVAGDIIYESIGGTGFNFGDGSSTGTLRFLVTSVNVAENWLFAVALHPGTNNPGILHTYSGTGPYTASSITCCRIGGLNNPGDYYGVQAVVTPGTGNRSPVSNLVPIVKVAQGGVRTWTIPASDADGDALRFALPSPSSVGLDGSQPSGLTIDPNSGQVSFDTNGKSLGLYWTHQLIQELDQSGNVKGRVGIDYLIEIVTSVANNTAPDLSTGGNSIPVCGSTQTAIAGTSFTITMTASDPDPSDQITLQATGLPPGATAPTVTGNPASSTFTWTPTVGQAGPHIISYTATDQNGAQTLCSFTVNVVGQSNADPVAHPGGPYTGAEGAAISFDGGASSDPDGDAITYAWEFGDGSTATGATATHAYADNGAYVVKLTVTDPDGAAHSMSTTATVTNVAPSATFGNSGAVNEGSSFQLSLTGATDPSSADVAAGFSYAFDCGTGAGYGAYGSSATASCPTTDDGNRPVRGKLKDKDGAETEYTASVTVNNVAPSVSAGTSTTITSGQTFAFAGSFADPGADAPWTTAITWGVGSPTTGTASAAGAVTATSPVYLRAGAYTVTLAVTDDHDTRSASRMVTVKRLEVGVDLKPGSSENPVSLKAKGGVPVAVLTTASFDARLIDVSTVRFGPAGATEMHARAHHEDVDKDGDIDLMLHFDTPAIGLTDTTTSLTLIGDLTDGRQFTGADAVRVVP